jgi:hypothetical protein
MLPDLLSIVNMALCLQQTLHAFLHCVPYESRPWQALSHGPAGDAAVGGVTLSPSIMAVAQGPSLAAASSTTVPGRSQPHILLAFIALL